MFLTNNKKLYLTGISEETVPTLGNFSITIFGGNVEFYIIPENFPIVEDGIIGVSFLARHQAKVNWERNCLELNRTELHFIKGDTDLKEDLWNNDSDLWNQLQVHRSKNPVNE